MPKKDKNKIFSPKNTGINQKKKNVLGNAMNNATGMGMMNIPAGNFVFNQQPIPMLFLHEKGIWKIVLEIIIKYRINMAITISKYGRYYYTTK